MKRALAAVSLVALAACHKVAPPPSRFPTAADALSRMKATYACARSVGGSAKVDSISDRGRVRGKLLFFAARPARLRFDVESPPPFSSIVSTLTADDGRFSLLDVRDKKFYEGPASACNIARLTEVPLEAHALVSLFGGQAPLLVHDDKQLGMEWSMEGYYVITIPSTRGAFEEVHLAPTPTDFHQPWSSQRLRVLDVLVQQQGIELYHASLGSHQWATTAPPFVDPDGLEPPIPPSGPACVVEIPHKIHIVAPESDQDVLVSYDNVKLNPPLPAGVFTQQIPGGVERLHVECAN